MKWSWVLPYREWMISILNKKKGMKYLFYLHTPSTKQYQSAWMLTSHYYNSTTTHRNNYFKLFDINCRYHWLILKSLNHYKLLLVNQWNSNFVIWNWQLQRLTRDQMMKLNWIEINCIAIMTSQGWNNTF